MAAPIYTYSLELLPPGRMVIDVLGGGAEAPRSITGDGGAIDFCAGLWSIKYAEMFVHAPARHRYWSWLGGILNTRVRMMRVPIYSDWFAPVSGNAGGALYITGIPHSDGSLHSDGTGYSQSTISAVLGAAAMGAGAIQITVMAGGEILGGEIFSINHPTQDHRAYKIADVEPNPTADSLGRLTYQVGLNMPLKEDVPAGTSARFDRPLCIMRLAPGATIPLDVSGFQLARPEINFLEAGDLG